MQMKLLSHSHTTGESYLHMQFTIAYRRKVLAVEQMEVILKIYLEAAASRIGIEIAAMDMGPEHVHVFLKNWKNHSIAEIAKRLKGFSSRMIRKRYSHLIKYYLWGDKFWSAGYFYRTVGSVTAECIQNYVEQCQSKHWA